MSDQNFITDEASLRRYRTEIPNLIDDLDLTVYDHRLYVHMKRVAGAKKGGVCQQGTRQLARKCRMSVGKVSEAKQSLADMGLIVITKRDTPTGQADDIHIVNIWPYNMRLYSMPRVRRAAYLEQIKRSLHERSESGKRSPGEHSDPPGKPVNDGAIVTKCSPHEHSYQPERSPGEQKKELKNQPDQNLSAANAAAGSAPQSGNIPASKPNSESPKESSAKESAPAYAPGDLVYYRFEHGWAGGEVSRAYARVLRLTAKQVEIALVDVKGGEPCCIAKLVKPSSLAPRDQAVAYDELLKRFVEEYTKPAHARNDLLDALALLCYGTLDAFKDVTTVKLLQRFLKRVKAISPDVTVDQIHCFVLWWNQHDFRGQKGQRPTPSQLPDAWLKFVGETHANPYAAPNVVRPPMAQGVRPAPDRRGPGGESGPGQGAPGSSFAWHPPRQPGGGR